MMSREFYHLRVSAAGCRVAVWLNGFELFELDCGRQPLEFAPPVNQYLIGKDNRIDISIQAASLPNGSSSTFDDAELGGNVARYREGDIVWEEGGVRLLDFGIPEDTRRRWREKKIALPLTIERGFDSTGASFRGLFLEGEVVTDQEPVVDYAMVLRDLATSRNVEGLARELAPKIDAYALAYQRDRPDHDGFRGFLAREFMPLGPVTDFGRKDVEARSFCGGRVWELRRKPAKAADPTVAKKRPWLDTGKPFPLLITEMNDEEAYLSIPVYVARIGGALKVVR